jgi:hypothetical protein
MNPGREIASECSFWKERLLPIFVVAVTGDKVGQHPNEG